MFLTAEFDGAPPVAAAIRALKACGVGSEDIELFSAEPVELPQGLLERPSRMSLAAAASAIAACLLTILFVRYTQHNYPLVTGGMPLFSWWATGVVFYELTMFGSIAAIVVMFLLESGLMRRRSRPVPVLAAGRVYVLVSGRPEGAAGVVECLRRAGGADVRSLP